MIKYVIIGGVTVIIMFFLVKKLEAKEKNDIKKRDN